MRGVMVASVTADSRTLETGAGSAAARADSTWAAVRHESPPI
jgi:hypothetical protein